MSDVDLRIVCDDSALQRAGDAMIATLSALQSQAEAMAIVFDEMNRLFAAEVASWPWYWRWYHALRSRFPRLADAVGAPYALDAMCRAEDMQHPFHEPLG